MDDDSDEALRHLLSQLPPLMQFEFEGIIDDGGADVVIELIAEYLEADDASRAVIEAFYIPSSLELGAWYALPAYVGRRR